MKRIGFVDYFLSEWHANNYPQWIEKNVIDKNREEMKVAYAYALKEVSPYDNVTTDEWCQKFGVEKVSSLDELAKKSDYIVILSPDNPEYHEQFGENVLKYGKPVFIDKTFAPDSESAERIFSIAEKYNTPLYSTSAMRYAPEIESYRKSQSPALSAVVNGPYNIEIYGVHLIEIMNTVMKRGGRRLMAVSNTLNRAIIVEYYNGRRALYNQIEAPHSGFSVAVEKNGQNNFYPITGDSFAGFIDAMLDFFETGKVPVEKEDTIEIMKILDAVKTAVKTPYQWIEIRE